MITSANLSERITYKGIMAERNGPATTDESAMAPRLLVEVTWRIVIFDTDGIGARLYLFVWRPNHLLKVGIASCFVPTS